MTNFYTEPHTKLSIWRTLIVKLVMFQFQQISERMMKTKCVKNVWILIDIRKTWQKLYLN